MNFWIQCVPQQSVVGALDDAEAEVTRDSELAAQLQNAHVKLDELKTMLDAHDNGSLSAEAVVRRMGELLSEPTTPDQG